jgi:hypothetical protein
MSRIRISSSESAGSVFDTELFDSSGRWLWSLVAVSFVLDIGLTYYGLDIGLREGNPVARAFFEAFGVVESMVLMKSVVVGMALAAWVSIPERYRPVIPIGVALPWLVASAINISLILQV